jgi:hypothetical protein
MMGLVSVASGSIGSIVGIVVSGIILYYLYRPRVKEYLENQRRLRQSNTRLPRSLGSY